MWKVSRAVFLTVFVCNYAPVECLKNVFVIVLVLCVLYLQEYISSTFCIFKTDSLAYENFTFLKVCFAGLWLTDSTHALCVRGWAPVLHKHSLAVGKYKPSSFLIASLICHQFCVPHFSIQHKRCLNFQHDSGISAFALYVFGDTWFQHPSCY